MNPELQSHHLIESKEKERASFILKGMPEYFDLGKEVEEKEREKSQEIRYVTINMPADCVMQCTKCARYDAREAAEFESAPAITIDEQKKFLDFAHTIGAQELVIIGDGEPTQANNWKRLYEPIIQAAHEKGMGTILFTTAFFLTKKQAEFCKSHDVTLIVSVDSLDNEKYRELYGIDKWGGDAKSPQEKWANERIKNPADHVKEKIKMLKEVFSDIEQNLENGRKVTRLGINTTISQKNQGELGDLRNFAHEHGMYYVANYLMPEGRVDRQGRNENFREMAGTEENYRQQQRLAAEYSDSGGHSSIKENACNYFADGVSTTSRGDLVICGYASATAHISENVKDLKSAEELRWIYRRNKLVHGLWLETLRKIQPDYVPSSCPVRDERYASFVAYLNENRLGGLFKGTETFEERKKIMHEWMEKKAA